MNPTVCFLLSCLFFCYAQADVSEILNKTNHRQPPEEIQTCIVLTTNPHIDLEANTVLPEHGLVPSASSVDSDVKAVTVSENSDAVVVDGDGQQLGSSHPDYQGPYQYEKPELPLEYGVPMVMDVPPEGRNDEIVVKDYLPPFSSDNSVQAKRHVRLFGRRWL